MESRKKGPCKVQTGMGQEYICFFLMLRSFATKSETRKERLFWLLDFLILLFVCLFFLFELVSAFTAGEEKSARRLTNSSLLFSPLRSSHLRFASCFWRALLRDGLRCSKEPNNESGLVGGRAQQAEIREPDKELLTMLQFTL